MKGEIFEEYSKYYDLLYNDKNYSNEVDYLVSILKTCNVTDGLILELGSGTGKHGKILAERGYLVHGIERSQLMVAAAVKTNRFTCECGDIRTFNSGRTYDAVISLFHVVSYITTNEDLKCLFANVACQLNRNGVFVFDFWYTPAVYSQKPETRVKRVSDGKISITRLAEPKVNYIDNLVEVVYTIYVHDLCTGGIKKFSEKHCLRHLSLPEIDSLALSCGFERVIAEEYMSGNNASEKTWGVCVVLKKI